MYKTNKKATRLGDANDPVVANARKIQANVEQKKENNLCIHLGSKTIQSWHGVFPFCEIGFDLWQRIATV